MINNTYHHYNIVFVCQYVDCLTDINNKNKNINKNYIVEVHKTRVFELRIKYTGELKSHKNCSSNLRAVVS